MIKNYRPHLGDGTLSTIYMPPAPRRALIASPAKMVFLGVVFAIFLWKGLPLAMVIMRALADGLRHG